MNSADRSKSKLGRGYRILIALMALAALLALFGPSLALSAAMLRARSLAGEQGFRLEYDTGAGFLFSSASLTAFRLTREGEDSPALSFDLLRLEEPSIKNIYRLATQLEGVELETIAGLADGLRVENLEFDSPKNGRVRLNSLAVSTRDLAGSKALALKYPPEPTPQAPEAQGEAAIAAPAPITGSLANNLAMIFGNVLLTGLSCQQPDGAAVELGLLEAKSAGDKLSLLRLENLMLMDESELPGLPGPRTEVGALTASGVQPGLLEGITTSRGNPLNFLTFCDSLDLVQAALVTADGQEFVRLRKAVFDVNESGGLISFSRRLELSGNLAALRDEKDLAREPALMALWETSGDSLELSLNLNLDYQPDGGQVTLRDCTLESPALGRLELGGRLSGVSNIRAGFSPYQLLFSSAGWNLEKLSLSYDDAGFMPAFYRVLDQTIFQKSPSRQSAANLMDYYVEPFAAQLEEENGLANLPALLSETGAFLGRPENISLSCAPLAPLTVLSLAKLDKYDILDKINLSVQVNQRAPVTVMTAKGVNHEALPSAPRPLENSFIEENM